MNFASARRNGQLMASPSLVAAMLAVAFAASPVTASATCANANHTFVASHPNPFSPVSACSAHRVCAAERCRCLGAPSANITRESALTCHTTIRPSCDSAAVCQRDFTVCLSFVATTTAVNAADSCFNWALHFRTQAVLAASNGYAGSFFERGCDASACTLAASTTLAAVCPVPYLACAAVPPNRSIAAMPSPLAAGTQRLRARVRLGGGGFLVLLASPPLRAKLTDAMRLDLHEALLEAAVAEIAVGNFTIGSLEFDVTIVTAAGASSGGGGGGGGGGSALAERLRRLVNVATAMSRTAFVYRIATGAAEVVAVESVAISFAAPEDDPTPVMTTTVVGPAMNTSTNPVTNNSASSATPTTAPLMAPTNVTLPPSTTGTDDDSTVSPPEGSTTEATQQATTVAPAQVQHSISPAADTRSSLLAGAVWILLLAGAWLLAP